MSIFVNPLLELAEYRELENAVLKGRGPVQVSDAADAQKPHIISELLPDRYAWRLVITYDEVRARQLYEDLSCFCENVYLYPARDILFFSADIRGNLISAGRIEVWRHIALDEGGVVVTTVDGLMDKLEDAESFKSNNITISENDRIDTDKLASRLAEMGFERCAQVEGRGQFAIRGGIIDIFPLSEELPVRIELWGDEIDSMRSFDAESQRSVDRVNELMIYPAREKELGGRESFLSYWDKDRSIIFIDEPLRVAERAGLIEEEFKAGIAGRLESGQLSADELPELFSRKETLEALSLPCTVCLTGLDRRTGEIPVRAGYSIASRPSGTYHNQTGQLVEDLKHYQKEKYRTVLLTASRTRASRLAENLREYGLRAYCPDAADMPADIKPGEIAVIYGNLHSGFEYPALRFIVISETDIFGMKRKRKKERKHRQDGSRVESLNELSPGDYVVHEDHGLGIYRGIEKIEKDYIIKDYIKIEYANGANCYVPATKLDIIQKYAGKDAGAPKLNKLGGVEWSRTKSRVKSAVADIAKELVELYASRLKAKGYEYGEDTVWQREFEELFPFEETEDQIRAIEDIKSDMQAGRIMDRLICGDVGYGKTEIALRAAFKVIQEGRQVIYLVPTTILAQQHYNTFIQRMKDFPVRVDLMCRFKTPSEQKRSIEDFKKGLVDIIIGTHRVLSKDIEPKNLGMIIIDEEQRFGVRHKEQLKRLKENVDVLTLTATPIPRTLHMSLVGIRDLSILEEPPQDRQPIQTYVMEYHDETVKEAIRRELSRGGQVYYVYNRVNNIAETAAHIQAMNPEASVAYAHGQMQERELESIMLDFINGDIDVLVSTTIIETGLDIPNANTMIIHDADRFGLSQLYQLRGRVGRSSRTAYAFLLYCRNRLLSEEAEKRLKAIKEFTELGSGIRIAMRDLEIRGAGNVLGAEQHGHMEAVGYELYCKLLNTAVRALKGEETEPEGFETSVDVDADAYIPSSYIKNEEQKLDIYKRIASIETKEDYLDMQDELLDRFGEMSSAVDNLLTVARIKSLARSVYITEVVINRQEVRFDIYREAKLNADGFPALAEEYSGRLQIRTGQNVRLIYTEKSAQKNCEATMQAAIDVLESMQRLLSLKIP